MEKNLADKRKTEKDNIYLTCFGADGGNNSSPYSSNKIKIDYRKEEFQNNRYCFDSNRSSTKRWPMRKSLKINKDENNVVQSVKLLISGKMSSFTSHIFE